MKRKLLVMALAVSLVFSGLTVSGVHAESKLDQTKKALQDIRSQKSREQANLEQVKKQLDDRKQKMNELEKQLDEQNKKVEKAKKDLQQAEKDLNLHAAIFKQRVREIYIKGDMGYMKALFSADSFNEFLARFETIRLIVKQDRTLLNHYFEAREQKEKDQQTLLAEQNKLKEEKAKADEEYQKIADLVKQHEAALSKLDDQEEATQEELDKIKSELAFSSGVWQGGYLKWPCNGPVTSPFGVRVNPVTGETKMHEGIDIGCSMGAPIRAAASGRVIENRPSNGYGWIVVIDHGGLVTLYAHMYGNTVTVNVGDRVYAGQKIAEVGNNGRSTGPHLHFEVHKNGQPVNPEKYLPPR
ncbi:murein hydrolase activator EnvC family protein [Polycladomyces subterraneus]|uniref:Peptidoglycan DD-metalloendopeptidase family protein n=1 Tax=Polycladomyces subterraneus TaxID=1016997 RepID=A0ABT8INR3_9BACL|nr:peptidoglycan DD-metalloendopeptidase family protein [Polycladomyces subterraneus]MDN4594388.1 peptidoglycan DD-metalloendopeptidase family protein [Polycladomyces subterraneus]